MKIVCVIPARLASTRFPRKILAMLGDKPLLQWVWEGAIGTELFDEVAFAIDDFETAGVIDGFGGKYFMTSRHCLTGTDRLIELQQKKKIEGDIWVNWQGDEPFIHKRMIEELVQSVDSLYDVWSLKKRIESKEEIEDPNIAKVVTDPMGGALYFSRSPIPYNREGVEGIPIYKHIGIYAYRDEALRRIADYPPSQLEEIEKLEQLRYLENGLKMQVHETTYETIGIDVPEDLAKAMEHIASPFFSC